MASPSATILSYLSIAWDEDLSPVLTVVWRAVVLSPVLDLKVSIIKEEEPTDWVSGLVVTEKPNGKLRVCIDPQHLHKALKRSHYPLPVIEDILPELTNVKVFSKADLKDGFLQGLRYSAKRNETKQNETKWNETKRNETKWLRRYYTSKRERWH